MFWLQLLGRQREVVSVGCGAWHQQTVHAPMLCGFVRGRDEAREKAETEMKRYRGKSQARGREESRDMLVQESTLGKQQRKIPD